MTPEEKAKELVKMFLKFADNGDPYQDEPLAKENAKQCALICCDEQGKEYVFLNPIQAKEYWNEVKKEIEKL